MLRQDEDPHRTGEKAKTAAFAQILGDLHTPAINDHLVRHFPAPRF
jgi:hypothetical protein